MLRTKERCGSFYAAGFRTPLSEPPVRGLAPPVGATRPRLFRLRNYPPGDIGLCSHAVIREGNEPGRSRSGGDRVSGGPDRVDLPRGLPGKSSEFNDERRHSGKRCSFIVVHLHVFLMAFIRDAGDIGVYLCAVVDWFSRRVLSWRLSITMETAFCIEAVEEARARYGKPDIFTRTRDRSSRQPTSRQC